MYSFVNMYKFLSRIKEHVKKKINFLAVFPIYYYNDTARLTGQMRIPPLTTQSAQ